jgi:hypothetical protein
MRAGRTTKLDIGKEIDNGAQTECQEADQNETLWEKECGAECREAPETLKRPRALLTVDIDRRTGPMWPNRKEKGKYNGTVTSEKKSKGNQ